VKGVEGSQGGDVGTNGAVADEGSGGIEPFGEEVGEAIDVSDRRPGAKRRERHVGGRCWLKGGSGEGEAG